MAKKKQNKGVNRVKQRPESNANNPKKTKLILAISLTVILVLAATIIGLLTKQLQPPQQIDQAKIASIPTVIKSEKEASVVQQDASSILNDVQDTLKNIDTSLPDV